MRFESFCWSLLTNKKNLVLWNCSICKVNKIFVEFVALIATVINNFIFLHITPCNRLNYFFTLTMEATFSSEASVDCQRIALRYTTEDRTLLNRIFVCFMLLAGFLNGLLIDLAPTSSSETSVDFCHISSHYCCHNLECDKVLFKVVVGLPAHQMWCGRHG